MNGLPNKTQDNLFARDLPKNRTGASAISSPDPISAAEPGPDGDKASDVPGEALPQIYACTRDLQRSCKKAESFFLGIGERLQTIHGQAGDLTRKASFTVELLGNDSADNVLTRVTRTAGEALEGLEHKQGHLQKNLGQVSHLGDLLRKLRQMGDQLKKISRFLKMVGINISIESSRSDDGEEIFQALAGEIRKLAVTVTRVTHEFVTDMHSVHAHLEAMHREMASKLDHFQQLSKTAKKSMEHTAPIVQSIIHRSLGSLAHMGEDAEKISQSVGNIVMSLQIHDNVSQRIEHIAEAMTAVHQHFTVRPPDDEPTVDGDTVSPVLGATLALQIAQLEQVVTDVEEAYWTSARAFEKIDRTIADIAKNMTFVEIDPGAGTSKDAASSSSAGALKKALKAISTMIDRGNNMVKELQGITHDATATVSRITQHMDQVREVNFDIHLKSLNAMFKSIRLGSRGKAIEALVQEMKDVANQSGSFVGQVEAVSGTILDAAKRLQDQFERSGHEDNPPPEESGSGLDTCIDDFSTACASFRQNAEKTVTSVRHLSEVIEQTAAELIFVRTFAEDLAAQLALLKKIHREISPDGETDRCHLSLKKAQIAAGYTMQQERDIHDRLTKGAALSTDDDAATARESKAETRRTTDETACEPFDDNVELF